MILSFKDGYRDPLSYGYIAIPLFYIKLLAWLS